MARVRPPQAMCNLSRNVAIVLQVVWLLSGLLPMSGCSILSRQRWDEHQSRESWMDVYRNLPTTKTSDECQSTNK